MKLSIANFFGMAVATICGTVAVDNIAFADCPGPFLKDVKASYQRAKKFENDGKLEPALRNYRFSEGFVCEGANPYEADAAARATSLGKALGASAEKHGDFVGAMELYEAGGHFADADRMYMSQLRTQPDNPGAYEAARQYFSSRSTPAFATNNAAAIRAAGEYRVNDKLIAELATMPRQGIERALRQETALFDEQYLRASVEAIQSRSDDPTDFAAMQGAISKQQALVQKWPNDPLKQSRKTLETLRAWASATRDADLAKLATTEFNKRIESHIATLSQRYSGAPKLLEGAIDYAYLLNPDSAAAETRVAKLKAQASSLGDQAGSKQRHALALDYYGVAGDDAKAQTARERMNKAAMAKMQPSIDDMQKQAMQLQAQFSDPAKVRAMQEQAQAMRASLQQQQTNAKQADKKSASDLEKELGL